MIITDLIQQYPRASIIIIAVAISFFISLVNYFVLDKEKMREIKAKQKKLQEDMKIHKDNPQKLMEMQKEMMSHTWESMRHSLKPMLITIVPLFILFPFVRKALMGTIISSTWFWYYLIASFASSLIFRKLLKLP